MFKQLKQIPLIETPVLGLIITDKCLLLIISCLITIKSLIKNQTLMYIGGIVMLIIVIQQIYIFKPGLLPGSSESFELSPSDIQDTEENKSIQDLIDEQTRSN